MRIIISGDAEARHGDVIHVLDLVRLAGIEKVAFEIRPPGKGRRHEPLFSIFNFLGVVVLCGAVLPFNGRQTAGWKTDVAQLDQTRIEQSAKIAEQERTLKDDAADLEDLRQRLSMSESELKTAVADRDRFAAEGKQLKAALDKWMAAVKARDAALKQAGERNPEACPMSETTRCRNSTIWSTNTTSSYQAENNASPEPRMYIRGYERRKPFLEST